MAFDLCENSSVKNSKSLNDIAVNNKLMEVFA